MSRPVTLFTGQWADMPIAELAAKCGEWGFDGLELASWGDHPRLIVRGEGFQDLTEPEVPSKVTVPATTVTKDNVDDVMNLGF